MHYLVTGHTGFKGAWVSQLLMSRGLSVSGVSLAPEPGALFSDASLGSYFEHDLRVDIRNIDRLSAAFDKVRPNYIIHLAAQPLVRRSYKNPKETFETNVIGTMNVLMAAQKVSDLEGCLIVTSDKVYRNTGKPGGYVESDPLGGDDPYSASKAMADIMSQSWSASFPSNSVAIARAGNVIGGGDIGEDRLVPDIVKAFRGGNPVQVRNPDSVRPWQHVLDCVAGYLALIDNSSDSFSGTWNFGPPPESFVKVGQLVRDSQSIWPGGSSEVIVNKEAPPESSFLTLDSSKARTNLQWRNKLDYRTSLEWTLTWEQRRINGESPLALCAEQIKAFEAL